VPDVRRSTAFSAAETFSRKLTETTTLTQSVTALWKTNNLDDALYTFGVSVAAAVSTRIQLKVEAIDTFKNIPPVPSRRKNDLATIIAIVYKI
jgi:putative salt-induced outer membrane protein YdiY